MTGTRALKPTPNARPRSPSPASRRMVAALEIVWHKPNPMPESVTDRPTSAHEKLFLFAKRSRYYYDAEAVRQEFSDTG